jgi:hypothetical protein
MSRFLIISCALSMLACVEERVCAPGRSLACVGPGACAGSQFCLPEGDGFSACECAGADAGSDTDAHVARPDGSVSDGGSDGGNASLDGAVPTDGSSPLLDGSSGDASFGDASFGDASFPPRDAASSDDAGEMGDASVPGPCTIDPHSVDCAQCLFDAPGSADCLAGPCATPFTTLSTCALIEGCCTTCVACAVRECPSGAADAIDCGLADCPAVAALCL